jgi:hypothetical protein
MIKEIKARVEIDEVKNFEGKDIDEMIAQIDSYLVSKK